MIRQTGRFGAEDPARSGLNWYTYCNNNPIRFIDPWGLAAVSFVDYIKAQGGKVKSTGEGKVSVTVNNQTSNWTLNSGIMDDTKINEMFGFSSFLTDKERNTGVGIGIRDNKLYRDIVTPGKSHYDLDYEGYTVRLFMDEYTMAVNMATGDGGMLSSNYDASYFLAGWLQNLYYEQYQKEFELSMAAISVELKAHADVWNRMSGVPWVGEHARIANIGVAGHELPWERWLWDQMGDYGTFGLRRTPMPPM